MPVLAQCATEMMARKISSTRMEAHGILALHAAGKYMDNERLLEFLNGCDSKAAIQTYAKCKVGAAQQDAASKAIQLM
jgi:hypothetical protein